MRTRVHSCYTWSPVSRPSDESALVFYHYKYSYYYYYYCCYSTTIQHTTTNDEHNSLGHGSDYIIIIMHVLLATIRSVSRPADAAASSKPPCGLAVPFRACFYSFPDDGESSLFYFAPLHVSRFTKIVIIMYFLLNTQYFLCWYELTERFVKNSKIVKTKCKLVTAIPCLCWTLFNVFEKYKKIDNYDIELTIYKDTETTYTLSKRKRLVWTNLNIFCVEG